MRPVGLGPLVVAEVRKLTSVRAAAVLLLAQVVLVLGLSVADMAHPYHVLLTSPTGQRSALAYSAGVALRSPFALLIGILVIAGEYRHGTVGTTFLFTPRRLRVMAAKMVVVGAAGLVFGLVAVGLTAAVELPWLAAKGYAVALTAGQLLHILSGAVVASLLFALIGLGLGALLRHQVAAVVLALVWISFVDTLVEDISPTTFAYLPTGAEGDLLGFWTNPVGLPAWAGLLLLVAYATALISAGTWAVVRRDVT